MGYLIKVNLKLGIGSRRFKLILLLLFTLAVSSFIAMALQLYGENSLNLRSPYLMGIRGHGTNIYSFYISIMLLLPLLSPLLYSDTVLKEKVSGAFYYARLRCKCEKYLAAKAVAIFILCFFTIFILTGSIEIMTWIMIPDIGVRGSSLRATYETISQKSSIFLSVIFERSPYLYNMLIISIMSFYSGVIGIFAFGSSLIITGIKSVYLPIGMFMFISLIQLFIPESYSIIYYLQFNSGKTAPFFIMATGQVITALLVTTAGIWKEKKSF